MICSHCTERPPEKLVLLMASTKCSSILINICPLIMIFSPLLLVKCLGDTDLSIRSFKLSIPSKNSSLIYWVKESDTLPFGLLSIEWREFKDFSEMQGRTRGRHSLSSKIYFITLLCKNAFWVSAFPRWAERADYKYSSALISLPF